MKNLADMKRALTTGARVTVTQHWCAALNGERVVTKAQTNGVYLSFPADHPADRAAYPLGSWMSYANIKAADVSFDAAGRVTIDGLLTLAVQS